MYGMVGTDQGKTRKVQPHHPHHMQRPISSPVAGDDPTTPQAIKERRRVRRPPKSITARFWDLIKHAWTGVKFALDSDLEEIETQPRYRPRGTLQALCRLTRFSEQEIKRIYRGFKAECPSGIVHEDTFREIYAQFFPQGANSGHYAHYVFNSMDHSRNGLLNFEDFVLGLSILLRGTVDDKLRWTFGLYDINGDGYITKDEMKEIVTAVFELMGTCVEPLIEDSVVQDRVDRIFQKMDQNRDGLVSLDEFLDCCTKDETILKSIAVFDSVI